MAFITRKMKTKKKTILWVCGAVAVLAVAVLVLVLSLPGKEQAGFETETISRGDMENSVTATGTVEPLKQVEVGTQVSGIIDKIYVDYNSEVKEGQIIAELDKNVLEAQLASARLSVESNRNEYEYQQKSYERTKSLYEQGLVSESEYETAEYNYRKAKIAYEQSLTQETQAATDLGYATIYSPIDGVVISKAVEEGQTVASSYSTPTLFTIANDLKKVQVVADVDEADIGSVEEGAEVTFSVDAYPGLVFEGRVNQVRMEAITTNNVVTYEVVIHADNPDLKLKPGLTANISIYSMRKLGVLRLPVKATRFRSGTGSDASGPALTAAGPSAGMEAPEGSREENGSPGAEDFGPWQEESGSTALALSGNPGSGVQEVLVFVLEKDSLGQSRPKPRKVQVGVSDRIYYEVVSGLSEGEAVCVGMSAGDGNAKTGGSTERSPFMPGPPGR